VSGGQRSVRTRLTIDVNDYVQGTARAEAATEKFGTNAGRVLRNIATGYAAIKLGGLITESVSLEAAYSKTMAQVAVATQAPQSELQKLDDLALKMGADTVFSAQDAAGAMLSLAKGGLTQAQIQGGALADTLTLASAGELELADAADTVVQAMGAFRLKASQTDEAVAALAGGANASSASVSDMTQALAQAGTSANSAGFNIQETTAYLALFANQGFKGSDAGTSLRTMLSRLVPQTKEAEAAMKALGLSYVDSNGNLVDAEEIAKRTQDAFSGLSDEQRIAAVNTIFGADAQRAINAITAEGDEGLRKYIQSTSDLTQAQQLADAANSGTAGSLESLKGSIETAQIQFGKGLAPVVQDVAAKLSDLAESGDAEEWGRRSAEAVVDFATEMRPLVESAIELGREALPVVASAGGTVVEVLKLAADVATPLIDAFNELPDAAQQALILAAGAKTLSNRLGPIPGLAGPAGTSLLTFGGNARRGGDDAGKAAPKYASLLSSLKGFGLLTAASFVLPEVGSGISQALDDIGNKAPDVSKLARSFDDLGVSTDKTIGQIQRSAAGSDIGRFAQEFGINIAALSESLGEAGTKGEYFADTVTGLREDFIQSIKDGKPDLDLGDVIGDLQQLGEAYDGAAKKAREQALAVDEQENAFQLVLNGMGKYSEELKGLPTKAVTEITTPGAIKSKQDVLDLADAYELTPEQVTTVMEALGFSTDRIKAVKKAMQELDGTKATVTTIQKTYQDTIKRSFTEDQGGNSPGVDKAFGDPKKKPYTGMRLPPGYFGGGIVPGTPPSRPDEDNIFALGVNTGEPLMVRSGEWIINEKSSRENDRWLAMINRGLRLDDIFTIPGFADGGRYDTFQSLTRSSKLDLLKQEQRIKDIAESLSAKETVGKGKNKHTRDVLRGIDRRVAEGELKEAKAELARMKRENEQLKGYGTSGAEKARYEASEAADEAADRAEDERKQNAAERQRELEQEAADRQRALESAAGEITSRFSLNGISSVAGLERSLNHLLVDSAAFTQMLADLAQKGASPYILEVLRREGPTKSAIKVGRQLLGDTVALGRVNTTTARLGQVGAAYADLAAGSGTLSSENRQLTVSIQALDVTQVTSEIQRVVRHEIASIGAGANI